MATYIKTVWKNGELPAINASNLNNIENGIDVIYDSFNSHVDDTNNPHKVTKTQVGLGNVADERQYSADNPPPYPVTSVNGETGAVELDKSDIGLGNVDNTSDANKPISTATQSALDKKANQTSLNATNAKLQNLIDASKGVIYKEVTDSSFAQTKNVATDSITSLQYTDGVLPYADMTMVGGMSRKGKNLYNRQLLETKTNHGVTITPNGDGTYTVSTIETGASENTIFNLTTKAVGFDFKANKTYKLIGCPSGGDSDAFEILLYQSKSTFGESVIDTGNGYVFTPNIDASLYLRVSVLSGTILTSPIIFKPMLTEDTSLTYDDYEPYSDHLIDAPVNKVTSVGKNLFDYSAEQELITIDSASHYGFTVVEKSGSYYASANDYSEGKYYYLFVLNGENAVNRYYFIAGAKNNPQSITLADRERLVLVNVQSGKMVNLEKYEIQIEKGSTATEYAPYKSIEKSIPTTITDLCPDYGIGINADCYNYIDFENKVYHHVVGTRAYQTGDENDTTVLTDGTTTYYQLETEETVDLADVIGDDFSMLEVEGGGTLDFHYPEYDNGYIVDMPSEIVYDVKISS